MNQERPAFSVVIPAHNEERRLPKTRLLIREWIACSGRETVVIAVVLGYDGATRGERGVRKTSSSSPTPTWASLCGMLGKLVAMLGRGLT